MMILTMDHVFNVKGVSAYKKEKKKQPTEYYRPSLQRVRVFQLCFGHPANNLTVLAQSHCSHGVVFGLSEQLLSARNPINFCLL